MRCSSQWLALCLGFFAGFVSAQETKPAPLPSYQVSAPKGAPNVVIVMLDDVGFSASSTFGGPGQTPVLDILAHEGGI